VTEPAPGGLHLIHEHDRSLRVAYRDQALLRYVYQPWDAQLESPRPYFHPVRTLGGDPVTLYRPHDHVWHKGIAWSLPNVGPANFWGGPTYRRGEGYVQLPNDGGMRHRDFIELSADDERVRVAHDLAWVTEQGGTWFTEQRAFDVTVVADAWALAFSTRFTNVSDREIAVGSPTTEGRDNAGYGGLFWRGPRSFTGGKVYAGSHAATSDDVIVGGDELMGVRAGWMGFSGQHDGHGRWSTVIIVDAADNAGHPTQWFVRSTPFACACPAPFFSTETRLAPGDSLALRYAVVIADGDPGPAGAASLAGTGRSVLGVP